MITPRLTDADVVALRSHYGASRIVLSHVYVHRLAPTGWVIEGRSPARAAMDAQDEDMEWIDGTLYALVNNGIVFGIGSDRKSAIGDALATGAADCETFENEDETKLVPITKEIATRIAKGEVYVSSLGI